MRGEAGTLTAIVGQITPGGFWPLVPGVSGMAGEAHQALASHWSKLLARPPHWSVRSPAVLGPSQELDNTIIVRHRRRDNTLEWLAGFNKTAELVSPRQSNGRPFVLNKMPKKRMYDG